MKRIFIVPILIFTSVMVLLYCVLPQFSAQQESREKFLKKEQDVKNRQEYFSRLRNTLSETAIYKESLDRIDLSMPGKISLADLIDFFDQKANNNGLVLKSISPAQTVSSSSTQSFLMVLGAGGVSSFESFLKDIETSSRLVSVENFSLKQEVNSSSMIINVQVKVYY